MAGVRALLRTSLVWRVPGGRRLLSLSASHFTNPEDHAPSRGPPYTTDFNAARTTHVSKELIPTYRVIDAHGHVIDKTQDPQLSEEVLLRIYEQMTTISLMDKELEKSQRMGLISFYMKARGEEATHFGSAVALDNNDMVYSQYREVGVIMWRGFTLDDIMNQCFSTVLDRCKGRSMPIHYGSREHSFQPISSCLATQMPQAPGYAYGLKLSGSENCVCVYFGDGAAQEGDSHAAMNFAATLGCPVIFVCRNNGYAISTPVEEQYIGDGIASRGRGYGMEAIRVDGNDVLAVYNVTKHAREVVVKEQRPVLIEAMTYRLNSHSTSDDQTLYQPEEEIKKWERYHPMGRLRGYLEQQGLWDQQKNDELVKRLSGEIQRSLKQVMKAPKPHLDELFEDVYDKLPPRLESQRREMWEHVRKYKDHYPLKLYKS